MRLLSPRRVAVVLLLLAPATAHAGGEPIPPGISDVRESLSGTTVAQFDLDDDGVFDAADRETNQVIDPAVTEIESQVGPVRSSIDSVASVSVSPDGKSITLTATIDCRSERPASGDVFEDFGVAEAGGSRTVRFRLGSPGLFQIAGSAAGSPPHVEGQLQENRGEVRFGTAVETLAQAIGNDPDDAQGEIPDSFAESGPLEPGFYSVTVQCHSQVPRQIGTNFDAPIADGSADVSLTVTTDECEGEPIRWVGGRAGGFSTAENWEPPQVPQFEENVRCDQALFEGGRNIVLDLDEVPSFVSIAAPGSGITRKVGRFLVDGAQALRPVDGTLEAESTSPIAGERSVEVTSGGSLLLDGGGVFARHLGVGTLGEGAIEVATTGGYLETTGRLGLGIEGSGSLLVRDGATVIAAEAVLGERNAQGSATVQGAASTLETGSFAVGLEDDGALLVDAGGQVTSETGVIGFDLDGEERGEAEVRGVDAAGNPSRWALDSLEVRPRGYLYVGPGGKVEVAGPLRIGAEGAPADCLRRRACVSIFDGQLSANGVTVGDGGGGRLEIGGDSQVSTTGSFTIATTGEHSEVILEGPSTASPVFTDLAVATGAGAFGSLEVRAGVQLDLLGRFRLGGPPDALGSLLVFGDANDVEATVVSAFDATGLDSVIGGPISGPAADRDSAQLHLESAVLEIEGNGHDLVIERTGFLNGGGGRIAFDAGGKLVNRGSLVGNFVIEGDYVQEPGAFLNATLLVVPSVGPAARSVTPLGAETPAQPFAPVVVTGDAVLAGTAKLQFGNGAAPRQGDAFELLQVEGEVTGTFDEVEIAGLAPGFQYGAEIVNGALVVTAENDGEPLPYVNLTGKSVLVETKKSAKLKLTRTGDTSGPLSVAYTVGGTATSGVDFVELPGTLDFAAGRKSATLLVRPIADALDDGGETIELTLVPNERFAPGLAGRLVIELRDRKAK